MVVGLSRPEYRTLHVAPYTDEWQVLRANGGEIRHATPSPTSPDIVAVDVEHPGRILLGAPGKPWRPLAELDDVGALSWRPDGSLITVSGSLEGQAGVFELDPVDATVTALTDESTGWIAPVFWSPWGTQAAWTDLGVVPSVPVVMTDGAEWAGQLGDVRAQALQGYHAGPFSPDGLRLLVHDDDNHWGVYDIASRRLDPVAVNGAAMTWWTPTRVLVAQDSLIRLYDVESSTFASLQVDISPWTVTTPNALTVDSTGGILISVHKEAGGLQRLDLPMERAAL